MVVVDMSRTRFCDSAGLNALVTADRRARADGGEIRLAAVGEAVARVVALTGVDRVCRAGLRLRQPWRTRSPRSGE